MYIWNSRIRYSETDETGALGVFGIMNYLQDCATFHSEEVKAGMHDLEERNRIWLLSSWQIVIDSCPVIGQEITVETWPTTFKGIYGDRDFCIKDREGKTLVQASSRWFLFDTKQRVPVRIQIEDMAPYGGGETSLLLPPAPKKIPVPEKREEKASVLVTRQYLDTNYHVNNAWYVEFARQALPEGLKIREIRADYKKAAHLGDVLVPEIACEGNGEWTVVLSGQDKEIFALVWLRTETQ